MIMLKVFKKLLPKKIVSRMTFIGQSKVRSNERNGHLKKNSFLTSFEGKTDQAASKHIAK